MPLPKVKPNEKRSKFISRCISFAVKDGMPQEQAVAACHTQWRRKDKMKQENKNLMFEYFVPIESSAELDGDFTINGIAINETTTSNGHKFIGEELSKAANTLIGVPLLKDHDNSVDSIVGKVNQAHWDEALRNIPFKAVIKDQKIKQLVKDGLLNSVSVGAHVDPKDIEETEDGDIIPHNIQFKELSVVAVPADGGATFGMALNNAYNLHSTKVENSTKTERRDNMTEEEEKTKEETKEETKEDEVNEEKVLDDKIKALRIKAKEKELKKLQDADADEEKKAEEPKEDEKSKEEEESEEEDEVEEKGDYVFNQGHKSLGIQRKSYVYN